MFKSLVVRLQRVLFLSFLLFCSTLVLAQTVSGRVVDESGEPLSYVTVAEESQSANVVTAIDGTYSLDLNGNGGELTFRYIGYEVLRKRVKAQLGEVQLDVTLNEATYQLSAATVLANAEDPAYRIMREAAARREQYLQANARYEAEVYVKSIMQVDEAPEKIFGQEIGDMDGALDSARAGIVYLSETYSTVYIEQPDRFRENIKASKISGNPQGYSFNTAEGLDFELYRKVSEFNKVILSPLAKDAPRVYRFKLEGSRRNEAGKLIYRISVTPRQAEASAYHGVITIEDESYHLLDADLYLLGGPLAAPGLDTLSISQGYRMRNGRWEVYQRQVRPYISLIGFRFSGTFTAIYQSYTYDPVWEVSPFGRVKTEVLAEANKVDSTVWEARPIPLTSPEKLDYFKKDSTRRVKESPAYRDSVERARNKIGFDALLGHKFSNWRKQTEFQYSSPLGDASYHPVPGLLIGANLKYSKILKGEKRQSYTVGGGVKYGWKDEEFYPHFETTYSTGKRDRQEFQLRAGRELVDIHRANPVSWSVNSVANMLFRENPLKVYERRAVELSHSTKVRMFNTGKNDPPVAALQHSLRYENRFIRENTSSYSLFNRDEGKMIEANQPFDGVNGLSEQSMLIYSGQLSYTPKEKFRVRPDAYVSLGSAWPTFNFNWRLGASPDGQEFSQRFAFVGLSARKDDIRIGRIGLFSARAAGHVQLIGDASLDLIDRTLFAGNPLRVNSIMDYVPRFLALDPYRYATDRNSFEASAEHNFDGALWSRLPLLNKLRWEVVVRGATLHTSEFNRGYQELGVGLSNIGFGVARFIRVDGVWSHEFGQWNKPMLVVGLNISLDGSGDGGEISF